MNSAPHLLREDRPEFERILDETLRSAHLHPGLSGIGQRLGRAQLRSMAISAAVPISACADVEYRHFVALRTQLRHPSHAPTSSAAGRGGAGVVAVVSVLAPLLAGTAAVIFLLVGYGLHLLDPEPALAAPMRGAGWTFAVLAAATALLGMGGVLLTALRNGPSAVAGPHGYGRPRGATGRRKSGAGAGGSGGLAGEVAAARTAWQAALLERGILPFLREALEDPAEAEKSPEAFARDLPESKRTPRLGYSHPGFSSPATTGHGGGASESAATGPRYSSPEYASPDYDGPAYGGPETQPE